MPTETQTPTIVIEIPKETKEASKRIAGGVVAAFVGASLAAWWVQNQAAPKVAPAAMIPTQAAVTAPNLAKPSFSSLAEREERVRRDVFFSNFAEASIPDFGGAELSAPEKARFAARHAVINVPERVQFQSGSVRRYVNGEWVAQTAERYFGEAAPTASGDYFLSEQDTAPAALRFARVEGFKAIPGGKIPRFAASVRVYESPTDWKGDPFAWTMTTTSEPGEPKLVGTWNATVAKIPGGYNPSYRYVLLSWKRI